MTRRRLCFAGVLGLVVTLAAFARADEPDIEKLIGQLVEVSEPGFGYSVDFSGEEFLPYEGTGEVGTLILGASRPTRSETLRRIVEQGAAAVPPLLKHLGDSRKCQMKPLTGMMWMSFDDEYDFNRRTAAKAPAGVNRDDFGGGKDRPREHALTVGDLCFVALGQIVNRGFSATRYQPTGGLMVSSPSYSADLRKAILAEWDGLTPAAHRQRLIEDFVKPDYPGRRTGAYWRLAFYYPDAVEKLVLEHLASPAYDSIAVWNFCRDDLYKTTDKKERQKKYDEFLRKHGRVAAAGVEDWLFDDLDTLEAHERRAISPPLTEYSTQPRELLIQLFGKPATVKSEDRPKYRPETESDRERFIAALTRDPNPKIGATIKEILLKSEGNADLTEACLRSLANRGQAAFLVERLARINVEKTEAAQADRKAIEALATSADPAIKEKLWEIAQRTECDAYFLAALPAVDRKHDADVLKLAKGLVAALPAASERGEGLLDLIAERYPAEAPAIFRSYLNGSPLRAEVMCRVLWYGHPLAKDLLAPMLDDKRELAGFSSPMRVCDRAAQAISHSTKDIEFNSDWSTEQKDAQIERLKRFCREAAGFRER